MIIFLLTRIRGGRNKNSLDQLPPNKDISCVFCILFLSILHTTLCMLGVRSSIKHQCVISNMRGRQECNRFQNPHPVKDIHRAIFKRKMSWKCYFFIYLTIESSIEATWAALYYISFIKKVHNHINHVQSR